MLTSVAKQARKIKPTNQFCLSLSFFFVSALLAISFSKETTTTGMEKHTQKNYHKTLRVQIAWFQTEFAIVSQDRTVFLFLVFLSPMQCRIENWYNVFYRFCFGIHIPPNSLTVSWFDVSVLVCVCVRLSICEHKYFVFALVHCIPGAYNFKNWSIKYYEWKWLLQIERYNNSSTTYQIKTQSKNKYIVREWK